MTLASSTETLLRNPLMGGTLLIPSVVLVLLVLYLLQRANSSASNLFPPGPKRHPIIGCMLEMPTEDAYKVFAKWKETYGDLVGLKILHKNMLILNSREAIEDLLVKRGAIYSSRPNMTLLSEWGKFDWSLGILGYCSEMHLQRRLLNQHLNRGSVKVFNDIISRQALTLTLKLHSDSSKFETDLNTMGGAVIIEAGFGFKVEDENNKWILLSEVLLKRTKNLAMTTGVHIVDIFPPLANLPIRLFGKELARDLKTIRGCNKDMLQRPFDALMKERAAGKAPFSMMKAMIDEHVQEDGTVEKESSIKAAMAIVYQAGAETTHSSLRTFLLAMMVYPEVQKRAQLAIDTLLKGERVPSIEDRNSLPYLEAVMRETLRWRPIVPLAIPHMSTEDDEYRGYHIPAGTAIFANTWKCLTDEKDFPEPDVFRPERFTDGHKLYEHVVDPRNFAFGYGRRICPGKHLAENVVWLNIALILYAFDLSKPLNASGNPIEPDLEYLTHPTLNYAKPFVCDFQLRSPERLEMIKSTYAQFQRKEEFS